MAADELKTIKFQMMLSPTEARLIDDWSFEKRIRSRAEAIRRLCQLAMAQEEHLPLVRGLVLKVLDEQLESFKRRIVDLKETQDEGAFVRATIDYERGLSPQLLEALHLIGEMIDTIENLAGRKAGPEMAKEALIHKIQVTNTLLAADEINE